MYDERAELRAEAEYERRNDQDAEEVRDAWSLTIPDYDEEEPETYPGDIKPGRYTRNQVVALLRKHAKDEDAIRFLADMLEE